MESAHLTQEINRLQSLLEELTKRRDHLNHFIDSHLALVSPARRLPDDVVREIFVAALPSDRNAIMSEEEAPLLLSHISQGWRNLALSTPRLWSNLHIVTPPVHSLQSYVPKLHEINGAVVTWLSRSGTLPVSISFVARRQRPPRNASDEQISTLQESTRSASATLIQTLIQFCARWQSIRFMNGSDLTPLAALSISDVPKLSSVAMDNMNIDGRETDWASMSFLGTPSLRAVDLRSLHGAHTSPINWDALTHLSTQFMSGLSPFDEMLAVLRHCTNLEILHLVIADTDTRAYSQTHAQPCHMAHLWRLSLITIGSNITGLLQQLSAPKLRILEYQGPSDSLLLTIISRANGLAHLRLSISKISVDSLIELLRSAPALRELALDPEPVSPSPPGSRTPHIPDGRLLSLLDSTICPRLQQLTLLRFRALSDDALLAFVQMRTDPSLDRCARLSRVNVSFLRARQDDIIPSLQQNIADGLEIRLEYAAQVRAPSPSPMYSVAEARQPHMQWDWMAALWDMDQARR
ncbi:hypothetical protein B0H11DRAFT_804917 [Mycena galericulata]|nr:hypothetical protein B0H11DRAFT_804917 [Mycena galericulata]